MSVTNHRPIALIGLMGAGKSAVARALGERLGIAVADLDAMIEVEAGRSIPEIFDGLGEAAFRRMEGRILAAALAAGAQVLACGGGLVVDPEHRETLRRSCDVVWLIVAPAEAARRLRGQETVRPLLRGAEPEARLRDLLDERAPLYGGLADLRVITDQRSVDAIADEVLAGLGARQT